MAIPSYMRDDRFMLVGLGIATASVLFAMQRVLVRYRDASVIKPIQPKPQYITQETEDSLPTSTLNSLLGHYNYSIRETAAKIVCDRAINDAGTLQMLLRGITHSDYDERMKNLRALAMLTDQNSLYLLNTRQSYRAFVRSLEHCVAEAHYEPLNDMYYDECYLRDMAEKLCLMFLDQLTAKFGVTELVRAQFIERWLAQQKWSDKKEDRMDNFRQYLNCRENRIADLCRRLRDSSAGRTALERAHLIQPWRLNPSPAMRMTDEGGIRGNRRLSMAVGRRRRTRTATAATATPRRASSFSSSSSSSPPPHRPATNGLIIGLPTGTTLDGSNSSSNSSSDDGIDSHSHSDDDDNNTDSVEPLVGPLMDPMLAQTQQIENLISFGDRILRRRDSTPIDIFSDHGMLLESYTQDRARGDGGAASLQPRPAATSSTEEQRIRRQHREAMVLNDGTRPLRRDDIIERESD